MKLEKKMSRESWRGGGCEMERMGDLNRVKQSFFMKKYHIGEDAIGHKLNYL